MEGNLYTADRPELARGGPISFNTTLFGRKGLPTGYCAST